MRGLLAVGITLFLAGCTTLPPEMQKSGAPTTLTTEQVKAVQDGVRMRLKDPASAMFSGEIRASKAADGEITACGLVNAKNSFGGYVGSSLFIALLRNGAVVDATIENSQYNIVANFCRQRGVAI